MVFNAVLLLYAFLFRCSAVYGGIYCLNQNVPQLVMDEDRNVNGITIDSKTITATSVAIESSLLPWSLVVTKLSRAILITNKYYIVTLSFDGY